MVSEFDHKTKEYAIGRPSYPADVLDLLREQGLNGKSTVADIGAGTGLLTNLLGKLDCRILAIEPNKGMMEEGINYCSNHKNIFFINASAEKTTLKDNTVDVITIAQSFHWFDKELSKKEFQRILKESGTVLILWNSLQEDSQFARDYNKVLNQYKARETAAISHFDPDEEKRNFFGQEFTKVYYDNWQTTTEEAFIGGAVSLSYTPSKFDDGYEEFIEALRQLFSNYQQNGKVPFHYKTEVCVGNFSK